MFFRRLAAVLSVLFAVAAPVASETQKRAKSPDKTAEKQADPQRLRREALSLVKSWAIQLRYIDRAGIARAPIDLIVIDHAPHPKKDVEIPFSGTDLAPLKIKADGGRRI
ncbi:MAG: hypothetical protein ABL907_07295, partial [Hyphomicrobium sp.]